IVPLLVCLSLGEDGQNFAYYRLLSYLRRNPTALEGLKVGMVVDGISELYTKSVATSLALGLSMSGATLVGSSLVEAVGRLENFSLLAKQQQLTLPQAYSAAIKNLTKRLVTVNFAPKENPNILMLHASMRETSNTLDIWNGVRERLSPSITVNEIGLRNGTVSDCAGCSYITCHHFGEGNGCFYGGVICEEVTPALREADALMLIAPNYNDALSANLTAFINRLTALFRQGPLIDKALFAIIVSGYSGGDMLATQMISALNMNKGFHLPAKFAMIERANLPHEAINIPDIHTRIEEYAKQIESVMLLEGGAPS
ncbi:MAG: NAD(P)H-dependent oxidoreductase, partial [Eubacteriales bacterium]